MRGVQVRRRQFILDRQGGQSMINSSRTLVFWFGKTMNYCKTGQYVNHQKLASPSVFASVALELDGLLFALRVEVPDDDAHRRHFCCGWT